MNTASVGLSALDLADITATVTSLVSDADTGTELAFTTADGPRNYDPATGQADYAETTTTVTGWLSEVTLDEVRKLEGLQVGDVRVLVLAADLPDPPATDARFRADGVDYRVHRATRGPLDPHHLIYATRVK